MMETTSMIEVSKTRRGQGAGEAAGNKNAVKHGLHLTKQ